MIYAVTGIFTLVGLIFLCLNLSDRVKSKLLYFALEKIKGFALDLVFEAEKLYKNGTGKFKKAYVINKILNGAFYASLPKSIRELVTVEVLSTLIDDLVTVIFNSQKRDNAALAERLGE